MAETKNNLIYADECYQIMGLIFEVFNSLGYGHKEIIYQKAIAKVFLDKGIKYKEQLRYKLKYREKDLGIYILDFLVLDKIVIELKQRDFFSRKDIEQLSRYLKATNLKLGLLVHFTSKGVRYKRVINLI
jgi:GxxExxY protein